jgi:surfeit locus 1 family protein
MLAVLVGLGTWQLERRAWKEGLIAERAARLAAPALGAADLARPPAELAFRRISLTGRFRHDLETLIAPRTLNGPPSPSGPWRAGDAGARVVTPFFFDGAPAGIAAVLVDRGWVPEARRDPATRAAGQVAGAVAVTGIVVAAGRAGAFTPDNDPARGHWYWADPAAIAARLRPAYAEASAGKQGFGGQTPIPDLVVPNVVVEADAAPVPGGLPIAGPALPELPNRHLEYALTWYSLAAALVVIYVLALRRGGRRA